MSNDVKATSKVTRRGKTGTKVQGGSKGSRAKGSSGTDGTGVYAFIVYPEHFATTDELVALLRATGKKVAISPLHDMDELKQDPEKTYTAEEESAFMKAAVEGKKLYKKAHYHVMIDFGEAKVDKKNARLRIRRYLKDGPAERKMNPAKPSVGISQVEQLASPKGYYEYFTHETIQAEEDGKHIYSKGDIILLNGFCVNDYKEYSKLARAEVSNNIANYICFNDVQTLSELRKKVLHDKVLGNLDDNDKELHSILRGENAYHARLIADNNNRKAKEMVALLADKERMEMELIDAEQKINYLEQLVLSLGGVLPAGNKQHNSIKKDCNATIFT